MFQARHNHTKAFHTAILLTTLLILLALISATARGESGADSNVELFTELHGRETGHVCELPFEAFQGDRDSLPEPNFISAETLAAMPRTANIQVNYSGNWTSAARNAFEHAVSIWERHIVSSETIIVEAEFEDLGDNVLGAAGPAQYVRNFDNAPRTNTWFPIALANSFAGRDLHSGPDINTRFNSEFDWYLGTDANPPFNQVDFVSVVLHELGHGFGFAGSFRANNSIADWGFETGSAIQYDHFVENGSGVKIISGFPNTSSALRSQLTSGSVYFDGVNTRNANGGSRARLYAPSSWSQGSSISHLDNSFNGTDNSLMTFSISNGVAEHKPGPVTLGIFEDMGWEIGEQLSFGSGAVMVEAGSTYDNLFDLWAFADDDSSDSSLSFTLGSQTSPAITATLDRNRYLDVSTVAGATGRLEIDVTVTDPDANSKRATFTIISVDAVNDGYLPMVTK